MARDCPEPRQRFLNVCPRSSASLSPKVHIEKIKGPFPSQLGCSLVVPGRCVVMETMIDALINVRGVGHVRVLLAIAAQLACPIVVVLVLDL